MSAFLHEHALQPVDTHDFTKTVKTVTGRNLDWFFDQYVFKPGHPVFEVRSEWDGAAGEVRIEIDQVQPRDHGVPIYRTPVRIGIVAPSGKRVETVWLERERESFVFDCPERPLLVRFDEGNWLLKEWRYEKSLEELLYQTEHDDVIGREWAVRELGRFGDEPGIAEALSSKVRQDPFWAVRLAAVEVLAEVGPAGSVALFREAATDESSRVRREAVRAVGGLGDPSQIPFLRDRFGVDDSYQVQAEALRAIGRLGDRSHLDFLREASRQPSPRDVIRTAAAWAIREIEGGT